MVIRITLLFYSILFVNGFLVKQIECTSPTPYLNLNNPDQSLFIGKLPSILNKTRTIVNRFECLRGWRRFGGSCYDLSNVSSTAITANDTCNTATFNWSQLMYIRHTIEFYYVAHILVKNDFPVLLVQIDPRLYKGKQLGDALVLTDLRNWKKADEKYQQARLIYHNRKMKVSARFRARKNSQQDNPVQSTGYTLSTLNDDSDGSDVILQACDKLVWNALNSDLQIFTLNIYMVSGEKHCAINDIEPEMNYRYMCEYVLDYCFNNDICGTHGRCVNNLVGFRCSCYIWSDGQFCQKVSRKFLQLIAGLVMIALLSIFTKSLFLQKYQHQLMIKITTYFKRQPVVPVNTSTTPNYTRSNVNQESTSPSEIFKDSCTRWSCIGMLMLVILSGLCLIPTFSHWNSVQFDEIDPLNMKLAIDHTMQLMTQCEHKSIWRINSRTFFIIAILLCLIFFILIKVNEDFSIADPNQPGICPSSVELFGTANRRETAALFGIVMVEVLIALEYYIIDLSELWNQGVLEQFLERALIPLLYSIRYYPIFISLNQRNISVRFLACIYTLGNIGYIIIRRSSCMDYLPYSKGSSSFEQTQRRLELGTWTIIYELIKNAPHFILLSYIGAELTLRFISSLISLCRQKHQIRTEGPITPNDGFRFHQDSNSADQSSNGEKSPPRVQKFIYDHIYPWEKDFQYTTIAMSAYVITILLLHYLTCAFILQSIMRTSSMSFLKFCLQQIFSMTEFNHSIDLEILLAEINDLSFDYEILLSAFLTMLFFVYQLFDGMKTYKKHTKELKKDKYENIPREEASENDSRASESMKYLASIFLNIVGGFFIWFHLILFGMIMFSLMTIRSFKLQIDPVQPTFTFFSIIASLLILFGLKNFITGWLSIFVSYEETGNKQNKYNKSFYTILSYLTFVFSCHIAVIYSILHVVHGIALHFLLMPRIDYSYLGRKWEKSDSGYMTYVSYLRMEKAHKQPVESPPVAVPAVNAVATQTEPETILVGNAAATQAELTPLMLRRTQTDSELSSLAQSAHDDVDDDVQSQTSEGVQRDHIDTSDPDSMMQFVGGASMMLQNYEPLTPRDVYSRARHEQSSASKPGRPQTVPTRNSHQSEQRRLMDSTPVNSSGEEEDNNPLESSRRIDKTRGIKPQNERVNYKTTHQSDL